MTRALAQAWTREVTVFEFKLPDLGEGIHEGEILKWHVAEGERVAEDAPLVDVETDKAAVTIPSPKAGIVAKLGGKLGDVVAVGHVIAMIEDGAEAATAPPAAAKAAPAPPAAAQAAPVKAAPAPVPTAPPAAPVPGVLPAKPATPAAPAIARPVAAAPATRRLARELAVDIGLVPATGPGGRVTPDDVQHFATARSGVPTAPVTAQPATPGATAAAVAVPGAVPGAAAPAPAADAPARAEAEFAAHAASAIPFLDIEPMPDFEQWGKVEREPLRSIRRKVAHKMVTSMILIPHVAHMDEADVTALEAFRKSENERRKDKGPRLTLLPFVVKAVTAGLKQAPSFNASLDPFREEIVYKKYYNIGVAVDTGRGLIVPVVRGTACKSISEIARDIEDLALRARDGKLTVDEMRGGTFTITNVGPLGGTAMIPTINYPEVAILGMGRAQPKPVVRNGEIVIRTMLPLTLAFDHRIADGADAARFVTEMIRHLADPNLLLLET
jgi:pyruvate dehydrogenase E2 component (dihydrolipoamide acetyltransferase)